MSWTNYDTAPSLLEIMAESQSQSVECPEIIFSESEEEIIPVKKRKQVLKVKKYFWVPDVNAMLVYYTNISEEHVDAEVISYDYTPYQELPGPEVGNWYCMDILTKEETSKFLNIHLCTSMCFLNKEQRCNFVNTIVRRYTTYKVKACNVE